MQYSDFHSSTAGYLHYVPCEIQTLFIMLQEQYIDTMNTMNLIEENAKT